MDPTDQTPATPTATKDDMAREVARVFGASKFDTLFAWSKVCDLPNKDAARSFAAWLDLNGFEREMIEHEGALFSLKFRVMIAAPAPTPLAQSLRMTRSIAKPNHRRQSSRPRSSTARRIRAV